MEKGIVLLLGALLGFIVGIVSASNASLNTVNKCVQAGAQYSECYNQFKGDNK